MSKWERFKSEIVSCHACPRLLNHCAKIAAEKRKAYKDELYWGKPVTGFGDPSAELILIGLAPAAHGANRTGRMFTGDRSGEWLYRALHKAGFSNQALATHREDGLRLQNAYITSAVKCAPPDNKPAPEEIAKCSSFLEWEIRNLASAKVYLGLGKIGFDQAWNILKSLSMAEGPRPAFGHGAIAKLPDGKWLVGSYHPSQQNTFTGKLTESMFDAIFSKVKGLLKP